MSDFPSIALLVVITSACMPAPNYVTDSGMAVYDRTGKSNAREVQAWLDIIAEHVPEDSSRVREISDILDGATLTIEPEETLEICSEANAAGCANGATQSITVAWVECPILFATPATLAHEVGHLLGYKHDQHGHGGPWFKHDEGPDVMVRVWKEVCQ